MPAWYVTMKTRNNLIIIFIGLCSLYKLSGHRIVAVNCISLLFTSLFLWVSLKQEKKTNLLQIIYLIIQKKKISVCIPVICNTSHSLAVRLFQRRRRRPWTSGKLIECFFITKRTPDCIDDNNEGRDVDVEFRDTDEIILLIQDASSRYQYSPWKDYMISFPSFLAK